MAFLLQIRLAEMAPLLPDNLLPASGMLYLFYDGYATDQGEDDEACRVFWWDGALASLQNTPYPEALPDELRFTAHSLRFTRELTLPPVQVLSFVPLELTDQERLSYAQVIEHISALQDGTTEGADRLPRHLLLGHPDSVQNDVIEELVSDAFTRDVSDEEYGLWQLVLQIDSDPALGMEWDDMGRLYICMRTGDLSARRFERARLLKQSY